MKRVENPPNPFESLHCEYFEGETPQAKIEIYEDATKSILARNDSPDLGFRWSLNPYRGCTHACAYCYARPSHEYLGFGAGSDFETKIVVKKNAPALLRQTFMKPSWKGEPIVFSGDTDCYQPIEASFQLTRKCLEVCLEFGNPINIITKSFLVTRDAELLEKIHWRTHLSICISIPFFNKKTARTVEPNAASIQKRFEALKILSGRGIETGVLIAPVIPGLNESEIPQILKKAKECGASFASPILLRLPGNLKQVFDERIKRDFPLRHQRIINKMKELRGGKLYTSEFGKRHSGTGEYWENIERIFDLTCKRLGLNEDYETPARSPFERPSRQKELF